MASPFIGEIKMFGGNFAPVGYAFCNGQLLPIDQNAALFSLLGTTYGGNGQTTFALPNLQSRVPLHSGDSQGPGLSPYTIGQSGGLESVTLTTAEMPAHNHTARGDSNSGTVQTPAGHAWAASTQVKQFSALAPDTTMNAASIGSGGGGQPHENLPPYLAISFIIALQGIFPSRN